MEPTLRLIFTLLQPTSQLIFLLLLVLVFIFIRKVRFAQWTSILMILLWLVYSLPFLPNALTEPLEQKYPVFDISSLPATASSAPKIIVLGAGHVADSRLDFPHMLSNTVSARLMEAVRIYHLLPDAEIVTSGSAVHGSLSQAESLKHAAVQLGVDPADIHMQEDPTNTCEEAKAFVRDHGTGTTVIIATSAMHMRRAIMNFEDNGAYPIAAPTDFQVKIDSDKPFHLKHYLPNMKNIARLEIAIKQYVGYIRGC